MNRLAAQESPRVLGALKVGFLRVESHSPCSLFTYRAGARRVEREARLHLSAQERATGQDRGEPRRRLATARRGGHAPPCRARLWLPVQHRLLPGLLRLPERAVVPSALLITATGRVSRGAQRTQVQRRASRMFRGMTGEGSLYQFRVYRGPKIRNSRGIDTRHAHTGRDGVRA